MMGETDTKTKLLRAAVTIFGSQGYSGGSVRQIAELAGTNIGAIKYHYSSKEHLWRAVVDFLFTKMSDAILHDQDKWPSMSLREQLANSTRHFIRFCAKYPELNRIILSETFHKGGRLDLLAEHMRVYTERSMGWTAFAQERGIYPRDISVLNLFFISSAASQNIFMMAPFIEQTFGIDVFDDDEIEKHADAVIKLLLIDPENEDDAAVSK